MHIFLTRRSFTTRQRGRPGGSGVVDPNDHDNIHVLSKNRGYEDGSEGSGGKVKVGRHIGESTSTERCAYCTISR